jgi:radical SAM protein with 4Fe4S-binding SPASM domain
MDRYLIDSHKLIWHLDRVSEWQEKRIITPIYIEISPVSRCNHGCIFCGVDFARTNSHTLESGILSKRLIEMGRAGIRSIMFAGEGEPLLHRDLPSLCRIADNAGIDLSLTTNGTQGSYDLWNDILPHLRWIRFSVDAGTREVYSRVHSVPEEWFERLLRNIRDSIDVRRERDLTTTIGIQYLVIEENLNDIENALRLFSSMDIDYISLKPYSLHPRMRAKRDLIYTEATILYIKGIAERYASGKGPDIIFRENAFRRYLSRDHKAKHCYALPFWGYISSSGDFYTCSVFLGDDRFKAGNIYKEDMDSILSGEARKRSILFGERELDLASECRVNCRMARVNEFLDFIEDKPEHINFV